MKWIDYRKKLGLGFNDDDKFEMLKNKFIIFIEVGLGQYYDEYSFARFCIMTGKIFNGAYPYIKLSNCFRLCKDSAELISHYIAFYNTVKLSEKADCSKKALLDFFKESLDSLNISYEILKDKDGIFVFPKGAKELDNALVSEPLEWLSAYPKAREEWIKALKEYSCLSEENASELADKFRKALERFFQMFFNCKKSLENFIPQYSAYLKSKGIPEEIAKNFQNLLDGYTKYNNNYAKHHNEATINVLEYLMYQTGNIMSLLLTLEQQ